MERISHDGEREMSLPAYVLLMLVIGLISLDSDPELKRKLEYLLARVKNKELLAE
jgi:hypothetical protein